jgi:predicted Co/Zn/Cd cation transporter (cation efflux family)
LTVHYAVNRLQFAIHYPEAAPPRIAAVIQRRLDLDDQQRAEVEQIVAKHQIEIAAIRRKFQPEIVDELDSVRDEIAAVLKEPQRERWTQQFEQFKQRWLPPAPPKQE